MQSLSVIFSNILIVSADFRLTKFDSEFVCGIFIHLWEP